MFSFLWRTVVSIQRIERFKALYTSSYNQTTTVSVSAYLDHQWSSISLASKKAQSWRSRSCACSLFFPFCDPTSDSDPWRYPFMIRWALRAGEWQDGSEREARRVLNVEPRPLVSGPQEEMCETRSPMTPSLPTLAALIPLSPRLHRWCVTEASARSRTHTHADTRISLAPKQRWQGWHHNEDDSDVQAVHKNISHLHSAAAG